MVRRLLTSTDKHDRFISTYVQMKHPDIYTEAECFYTHLDQIYPEKRDLRKTAEFLHDTQGVGSVYQHYYRNRCHKKKTNSPDNMMLKIQFLDQNQIPMGMLQRKNAHASEVPMVTDISSTVPDVHADEPSSIPDVHTDESSTVPDVHADEPSSIPDVHTDESSSIPDVHADEPSSIPDVHADEPLCIPDNVYQDLLRELRKDPDLKAIFNEFESSEEDDIIDELIPHADEETPLEWELHNLGY